MKRIVSIILCVLFVLSFAACGQSTTEKSIVKNNITDSDSMLTVETAIGRLSYPEKWKDKITFAPKEDKLDASCGEVKLFTIYFGGTQGDLYGTLHLEDGDKELRYEMYDIPAKAENTEDLYAMQEDMNVIFQYLIDEGKLKVK